MKASFVYLAVFILTALFNISVPGQSATNSLGHAADKVLLKGKDGTLNIGFARYLGLKADKPLALKRIQIEQNEETNLFNVLTHDTNTIILSERRQNLTKYYLTDRSGTLLRAVVNDSSIADGGLTNLVLKAAVGDFEKQKKLWLEETGR